MVASAEAALAELAALETASERALAASRYMELLAQCRTRVGEVRMEAVGDLRRQGWSLRRIATHLNRSVNAIVQIEDVRLGRRARRPDGDA